MDSNRRLDNGSSKWNSEKRNCRNQSAHVSRQNPEPSGTNRGIEQVANGRTASNQGLLNYRAAGVAETGEPTRLVFMGFMGLIAAISLVVGGIGIMNIILATVTERTRDFGIRREMGAKRKDVIRRFLIETIVLSAVGGNCGIAGELVSPLIVVWLRVAVENWFPQEFVSSPDALKNIVPASIPLAFGIAVGVGVLLGIYPAIRAANLDPIEALCHM